MRWSIMNDNFNNIDEISNEDLNKMDFYEKALYIQTLNKIEELHDEMCGDDNE